VKFVARREDRDEIEELVAAAIGGVEDDTERTLAVVKSVRVRTGRDSNSWPDRELQWRTICLSQATVCQIAQTWRCAILTERPLTGSG
jgi:hypothetical protein